VHRSPGRVRTVAPCSCWRSCRWCLSLFSYARVRLHRLLATHLSATADGSWRPLVWDSMRSWRPATPDRPQTPDTSILQSPGVVWMGAVWFSAHALLLLGYGLTGLVRRGASIATHAYGAARSHAPNVASAADGALIGAPRACYSGPASSGPPFRSGIALQRALVVRFPRRRAAHRTAFWPTGARRAAGRAPVGHSRRRADEP